MSSRPSRVRRRSRRFIENEENQSEARAVAARARSRRGVRSVNLPAFLLDVPMEDFSAPLDFELTQQPLPPPRWLLAVSRSRPSGREAVATWRESFIGDRGVQS